MTCYFFVKLNTLAKFRDLQFISLLLRIIKFMHLPPGKNLELSSEVALEVNMCCFSVLRGYMLSIVHKANVVLYQFFMCFLVAYSFESLDFLTAFHSNCTFRCIHTLFVTYVLCPRLTSLDCEY